jgi:hypothetical protein
MGVPASDFAPLLGSRGYGKNFVQRNALHLIVLRESSEPVHLEKVLLLPLAARDHGWWNWLPVP